MQAMPNLAPGAPPLWDIFCAVVDNHGDLGVCWRLSRQLRERGVRVRLWVDDATALAWMAPGATEGRMSGIEVRPWQQASDAATLNALPPADVWVEAFGCELPTAFVGHFVARVSGGASEPPGRPPAWINL